MKRWIIVSSVVSILCTLGLVWFVSGLLEAIDSGKLKRYLADAAMLVEAIEQYRHDNGRYPLGFEAADLEEAIVPEYIRIAPMDGVGYCSDGDSYVLIVRPFVVDGGPSRLAPIEIHNGIVVSWPMELDTPEEGTLTFDYGSRGAP